MTAGETLDAEGVIKFSYSHTERALATILGESRESQLLIEDLLFWRERLCELGVVGVAPDRYQGLGFGNLSARVSLEGNASDGAFVITGSQTGKYLSLAEEHLCVVREFDLSEHRLASVGLARPSSESMTHAAIYAHSPEISWVFHGHCPEIWQHRHELQLATSPSHIPYGTAEMAQAIVKLRAEGATLIAMGGHEDGILSLGRNADEAGQAIIRWLNQALAL